MLGPAVASRIAPTGLLKAGFATGNRTVIVEAESHTGNVSRCPGAGVRSGGVPEPAKAIVRRFADRGEARGQVVTARTKTIALATGAG